MITLYKKSKRTQKVNVEIVNNYDELERKLSKISTAHYDISEYYVESLDFEGLVANFKARYIDEYYTIDGDLETININKLDIGQKRKKFFKKERQQKSTILDKAIKRLQKKYNLSYDKDMNLIVINMGEDKVALEMDEEEIKIKNISFNDVSIEKIKEMSKLSKEITKYFDRLSQRINK